MTSTTKESQEIGITKKTFVMGDIHGNYKALVQCLQRSNFDYENDTLITLGDLVDGHSQSYEVVEELLKIKNRIDIRGNHDDWFTEWMFNGTVHPQDWLQGGQATLKSYCEKLDKQYVAKFHGWQTNLLSTDIPEDHEKLFRGQHFYYIDDNNNLFIHGGFNRHLELKEQKSYVYWWDRDLWSQALSWQSMTGNKDPEGNVFKPPFKMKQEFNHIFIGHTSTQFWDKDVPMTAANITNLDTGAGWYGKLTIMNVETREFFQSDSGRELYPEYKGRS